MFNCAMRLHDEGLKHGKVQGKLEGRLDGFITGQREGVKLGEEMGFYLGFIDAIVKCQEGNKCDDKISRAVRSLSEMVGRFDIVSYTTPDYQAKLSKIRSKFHQILSLLRIDQNLHPYKEDTGQSLSF